MRTALQRRRVTEQFYLLEAGERDLLWTIAFAGCVYSRLSSRMRRLYELGFVVGANRCAVRKEWKWVLSRLGRALLDEVGRARVDTHRRKR